MINERDRYRLRELARRVAEVASLPTPMNSMAMKTPPWEFPKMWW